MDMAGIVGETGREDQSRVRMIAMSEQEPVKDGLRILISRDKVPLGVTVLKRLIAKGRTPTFKRDLRDDVDRNTGRPTLKELTFDSKVDRYTETVTVKATGEIIVKKVYRLSEKVAIEKAFRHYRELSARLAPQSR